MTQQTTPVTETQSSHVSVRAFLNKPVSDNMLSTILNAARRAPTSSNTQTYSIIVVRDPEKRKKLAVLAGNQAHIEQCDLFIGFCADLSRMAVACEIHGTELAKSLELSLVATVDAALVGMSVQTAAESFGLGAVMIGGMRNHPQETAALLNFPPNVYMVYGMSLGWPDWDNVPSQKPRMPESLIIHHEQYDSADPRDKLQEYDRDLAAHYGGQNRNLDQAAWTGVIGSRFNQPRRPTLRATLERMGFSFE